MKDYSLGYDLITALSFISTCLAIITSLFYPEILKIYFWQIILVATLVVLSTVIMFFKRNLEENRKDINKLKERIDLHKDIINLKADVIDLKAKVSYILSMKDKRGKEDLMEAIIRIIQIGAIIFAGYIILKALSVI